MKDLTKQDIAEIVRESNQETLEEFFPSDQDQATKNREEILHRYGGYVDNAKSFMDKKLWNVPKAITKTA